MPSFTRQTVALHGSYPDLVPEDAPAEGWNTTNNVWFLNGETRRVAGDLPVMGTPLTEPRTVCFYQDASGQPFWVYAGPGGIFVTDGITHWDITPTSGWSPEATGIYTSVSFNGFVVINCSTEHPFYWPGATSAKCLALPGWPDGWRCIAMRQHKWFLFAIGMLNEAGFQRVRWSDAAEAGTMPQSWEPTEENLAGFTDLVPFSGPAIDGVNCRDSFLVLKDQAIHTFDFVGGNAVFSARRLFTGIGVAGVNAIAEGPSDQFLFAGADGDLYRCDGVSFVSALDGKAQRTFYDEADEDLLGKLASVTLTRQNVSWLFYPSKGAEACDRALCYSWETGDVGFRDAALVRCAAAGRLLSDVTLQNSWDGAVGAWNTDPAVWNYTLSAATGEDVIAGAVGPELLAFENTDLEGSPLPAQAFKTGLSFGDPQMRKLAKALWPRFRAPIGTEVMVRFGGQDTPNGPISWNDAQPFVIGAGRPVEGFAEGRFLAIEVSSEAGPPWALGSFDIEFRGLGQW